MADSLYEESWFFHPGPWDGPFFLDEEESHHLARVLRVRPGSSILVVDGKGGKLTAVVEQLGPRVRLTPMPESGIAEPRPLLSVLQPVLKGRDVEDPVEALCQLSVACIQLVATHKSEPLRGQSADKLMRRLETKARSAMKQSKRTWLTEVLAPVNLEAWLEAHPDAATLVCHPGADNLPANLDAGAWLLCGPEAGFSPSELQRLLQGYRLGLGHTRLRAREAPLVACGKLMGLGLL